MQPAVNTSLTAPEKEPAIVPLEAGKRHPNPDPAGKTAAEYAYDAMSMHNAQYKDQGKPPPALLKWIGDAALAVLPMNRMYCAIGLTAGLMFAGNMAKIATGFGLDGKAVEKAKVPTYLQSMYKVVKDHDPKLLGARTNKIKYIQWAVYSLGGFIGIKMGTDYAYRNVHVKNANPKNLEDHLARVSMHQGETWSWLAATAGVFGSASGLFALPIPGLNYALGLAGRTTSMQDRNFMIKGMNEMMSGATTPSYLRLREGLHYMCHYAAANPSENPAQLEFLAYTLLGPIFKEELKAEHIQQFVDAVHEVRDPFWQPGGIPKAKRKEAVATMKEVFTGAGLEALLINMGLNPGTIQFDKLNGLTGKIGNFNAMEAVQKEQVAYLKELESHVAIFEREGIISPERAKWARAGIEATRHGKPAPKWHTPAKGETFAPDPKPGPSAKELAFAKLGEEPAPIEGAQAPVAAEPTEQATEKTNEPIAFTKEPAVSIGAQTRENPMDNLIKNAQRNKADWREAALGERQSKKSPAFVVE